MPPIAKPVVRRQPTTKTGGTVTRKVKTVPSRKPQQDSLGMPLIVGNGVGAVRGIRDMRNNKGRK